MTNERIIDELNGLIRHRLQEREAVTIECIGTFTPKYIPEYLFHESSGELWLMPPAVALTFEPSDYLLSGDHYRTLEVTYPKVYIGKELTEPLSDLLELPLTAIETAIREEIDPLLEALFRGRRATLLSLGDLYISEEVADLLLLNFAPAPTLIQALNTPFSVYKEVMVPPHITWDDLEEWHERIDVVNRVEQAAIERDVQKGLPETDLMGVQEPEEGWIEEVPAPEQKAEEPPTPEPATLEPPAPTLAPTPQPQKRRCYWWVWVTLLLLVACGVLWFYWLHPTATLSVEEPPVVVPAEETLPDTIVEPEPPLEPIDTIQIVEGSSLAKFAGVYYGNNHFWVYIYMENAVAIRNPNNVPIGTSLAIPPKSKYEQGLTDDEALQAAKLWEPVILGGRYRGYDLQKDSIYQQLQRP